MLDRLGTKGDLKSRVNDIRVYLRQKILDARTFIYEMALPITGTAVENVLKPMSLVPTMVCRDCFHSHPSLTSLFIDIEFVRRAPPGSRYRVQSLANASR